MLRLFCQQSCRRCACPFSSTTALALPLSGAVNGSSSGVGSGSALAVTASAEPAAAAPPATSPAAAVLSNGGSAPAFNSSASSQSPAANSSAASPPPASSETPQQQMVDHLFDALQSFASANAANDSSAGDSGPGGCRTDVLNFLR